MRALLEARNVTLPGRLEPCDLDLVAGELTMLVGPNGAGKTSLLHALAGIGEAQGEVHIEGRPLRSAPPPRRIELLAYLGASREARWPLLVRDFVALGLHASAPSDAIEEALERAAVAEFADRRIDRLSTGERSRVMLARALAPGASAVLLDEPCANLDPQWQLFTIDCLRAEAAEGRAVLMSVHDLALADQHADRVIVVDRGAIVASGVPSEALSDATIAEVFGVASDAAGRWRRL